MSSALEDVADAAEEVAADHREVARRARRLHRRREQGWSWAQVLDHGDEKLFPVLRRAARRSAEAAGSFALSAARELSSEGASRRQIARLLGVSHQRVTALLNGRNQHDDGASR